MTAALARQGQGHFESWQEIYARHGIPVFPLDDRKTPLVKNWQKVTAHAARSFANRFPDARSLGFCPDRIGIVVLDIDTTDRTFAEALFDRFGSPRIIVETASGKLHGYYRHSGEKRSIRPEGSGSPFDILGSGLCVAPGSITPTGKYRIIKGDLGDLADLWPMDGAEAFRAGYTAANDEAKGLRDGDGRANTLFHHLGEMARRCDDEAQLLDVARQYAEENFSEPLGEQEITKTVASVWRYQTEGRNFIGLKSGEGRKVILDQSAVADLAKRAGHGTLGIYAAMRSRHSGPEPFTIPNAAARDDDIGASRREIQKARNAMLELGIIVEIRRPSQHHGPALFQWGNRD